MAYQTFRNEYMNMPPVTRAYTTACVITTLAVVSIDDLNRCFVQKFGHFLGNTSLQNIIENDSFF